MKFHIFSLILLMFLSAARALAAVDWPVFMSRQDMVWTRLPSDWADAPFLGNGYLGTYVTFDSTANALRLELGNSFVHDHRRDDDGINGRCRLLIGTLMLKPRGRVLSGECRLDLWNARLAGTLVTSEGTVNFSHSVPLGCHYVAVRADCTDGESVSWDFMPAVADSPRQLMARRRAGHPHTDTAYVSNPAPVVRRSAGAGLCLQPLLHGGMTATAWRTLSVDSGSVLVATVQHSFPSADVAPRQASAIVSNLTAESLAADRAAHERRWHDFYRKSFVSLPDKQIENFYWAQIYKLGAATQPDGAIMDNCGPWLTETPWPNVWWNLNVQLAYWPLLASNHLELNAPLINAARDNFDNLVANVKPPYRHDSAALPVNTDFTLGRPGSVGAPGSRRPQIGCLPWLCHNLWLHYRYTMDTAFLRDTLYPLLRRAINYYFHFAREESDGRIHLAPTYSPEYGTAPDCNFDLALFRWGASTLLESSRFLGIDDPLAPRWRDVCARLADWPCDSSGMMIGRDMPYARSHRHYSHLLMFFPLYLLNAEQPGAKELMMRSVSHWHSIPGNILAYSFTGASSMYASFGEADLALENLRSAIAQDNLGSNTLYHESGPVIETPLSAARCVHDMLLQSWGGKIRVFPAVPSGWADVAFGSLRAEGAFLVSATRTAGRTSSVTVKSLAGEPCVLVCDIDRPQVVGSTHALAAASPGEYIVDLRVGESVTIVPSGSSVPEVGPVEGPGRNLFGSDKRLP